jgi:predicted membrane GTPase involved in stress response
VDFPLSQLITSESGPSQRWFAQEAAHHFPPNAKLHVEATADGLLLRANTELELELACHVVLQLYPGAKIHKPQLRYLEGPPLQEPYYRIVITTPEDSLGYVMADLNSRRASIVGVHESQSGKRVSGDIPVNECLGYDTQLRSLTRGRGAYEVEFIGYRPCWGSDGTAPVDVA